MIKITYWRGLFAAQHETRDDESLLKRAGFLLHEPTLCEPKVCRPCRAGVGRRYWSPRVEDATKLRRHCLPRALAAMGGHLRKLAQSRATDAQVSAPAPPGLSYRPFQRAGIAYALARKDTLFGDDMGLGKTVESLGVANALHPRSLLVVCPATLVLNWRDEAERWLVDDYELCIPETTADAVPAETSHPLLVITNYEKIAGTTPHRRQVVLSRIAPCEAAASQLQGASPLKLADLAESARQDARATPVLLEVAGQPGTYRCVENKLQLEAARAVGWTRVTALVLEDAPPGERLDVDKARRVLKDTPLSRSLKRPWDLAIFDEAQAVKNPDSQRSRAVLAKNGLYPRCRRTLFLSGTPLENYPREIWPLASALCPAKFGDWWDFARRYCGLHQEKRGSKYAWVADGSTNWSELQQKLRTTFMIRRLKRDVLRELPPKRRQLILLEEKIDWSKHPEFQRWRELYERLYDEALAQVEAAASREDYLRAVRKLDTITVPFAETSDLRHKTALLKVPACLRFTDQVLDGGAESIVLFAHHRDVLEKIHEHYGDDSCVIYGDTPMKQRMPIVREFQEGKKKIFIGGLKAAGVGITLTRSSTGIFFETDWNPATVKQGEDRMDRIGQRTMVQIFHPVLDGSLDATIVKKMVQKQENIDKVLDRYPEAEQRVNPRQLAM